MENQMEMKKNKLLVLLVISTLMLTSCRQENSTHRTEKYTPIFINIDSNTVRVKDEYIVNEINNNTSSGANNTYNNVNEQENVFVSNEVKIEGSVNVDWTVLENGSIIYKGITYHNLYNNVSQLDMPCDKNAFIKFILTTFKTRDSDIYSLIDITGTTNVSTNTEKAEEPIDIEDTDILDSELQENPNYISLCNKYDDHVTWQFTIYEYGMKHFGNIYGCKSFIMCENIGKDRTITFNEIIQDTESDNEELNVDAYEKNNLNSYEESGNNVESDGVNINE